MFYEEEIPEIPHIALDKNSSKTYTPFLLSSKPLLFSPATLRIISDAERAFCRVDEHLELSPYRDAIRNGLVNAEAISASIIDGIPCNLIEMLEHDLDFADAPAGKAAEETVEPHLGEATPMNYKRLIERHTNPSEMRGFVYNSTNIYGIYVQLLGYDLDSFRPSYLDRGHRKTNELLPIITSGSSLPSNDIGRYMEDFFIFCNRNDYTPMIQSSLVHFQLSSIRPLEVRLDALGRHLSLISYARRNLSHNIFMPIATASLRYRTEFRQISPIGPDDMRSVAGRPMDIWLINAAGNMLRCSKRILQLEQRLASIEDSWRERMPNIKHGDVCDLLLIDLLRYPVTNTSHTMAISGRTFPAANEAIKKLVECDILSPTSSQKRNRTFIANDAAELYTDFFRTNVPSTWPYRDTLLGK